MSKRLVTERDIVEASRKGLNLLALEPGSIVTPSARDAARQYGIKLAEGADAVTLKIARVQSPSLHNPHDKKSPNSSTVIALGSDHGGFQLKETIKGFVLELGYTVADVGTHSEETCDYPDFAYAVASMVASRDAARGIMIDAVGVASAIVANKVPGIRAVPCDSEFVAKSSREHNDANVLTLGGRVLGAEVAKSIVRTWLATWYGGGRHQARIRKISDIEKKFTRS